MAQLCGLLASLYLVLGHGLLQQPVVMVLEQSEAWHDVQEACCITSL